MSSARLDPITVPVLVGVTGHRDLLLTAKPDLYRTVRAVLRELRPMPPNRGLHGLHVLTALAEGADQLVAEAALEVGIPLVVVSPMPFEAYRLTMALPGRAALDRLWNHPSVALRLTLPWIPDNPRPDETADQAKARRETAQYEQLGLLLSRQSHILLALWNGEDPEPPTSRAAGELRSKRGGSAHVVAMRIFGEREEVAADALRAAPLLADQPPLLELARSGPVLHVVSPRSFDDGRVCQDADRTPQSAGTLRWWSDIAIPHPPKQPFLRHLWPPHQPRHRPPPSHWEPTTPAGLHALIPKELYQVSQLGPLLAARDRRQADDCTRHASFLCPDRTESAEKPGLDALPALSRPALIWLRRLFAAADVDAVRNQAWLLGTWSPGMRWRPKAWWRIGALLLFALAVPAAAFFFEVYSGALHGTDADRAVIWLRFYAAALAIPSLYYLCFVRPLDWQARQQDHRAFAEALRIQFFWSAAGIPVAVSDNYLGQHADALGWIRLALRGPALWAAAAALEVTEPAADLLRIRWLDDQMTFFEDRGEENERAANWMSRGTRISIVLLLTALGGQLIAHGIYGPPPPWMVEFIPLALGVLPALAAFCVITSEGRSFEAHAHAYARAQLIYKTALKHMERPPQTRSAFRELVLAIGREALAENGAWLEGHRARPVVSRVGG